MSNKSKVKRQRRTINLKLPQDQFKVRNPKAEDIDFIFNSWLKSYRMSSFAQSIRDSVYYLYHENHIRNIMAHNGNNAAIICDTEDENHILGWIVFNNNVPLIHYIYVKHSFRNYGLGRYMLAMVQNHWKVEKSDSIICTHIPKTGWRDLSRTFKLEYNPYVMGAANEEAKEESKESQDVVESTQEVVEEIQETKE